jgi:hypothetical protein
MVKSAEAIESAVHVGSGASFSVSRQRVYLVHIDSAYKDITEPVIRLNSDQAAKLVAVPELKDRPQSVAYKTVNVLSSLLVNHVRAIGGIAECATRSSRSNAQTDCVASIYHQLSGFGMVESARHISAGSSLDHGIC